MPSRSPLSVWGDPLSTNSHHLASYSRDASSSTPVHRHDATVITPSGQLIPVPSLLLDTGSSHFSFISPQFLDQHPDLTPVPIPSPTSVRLGDNSTTVLINKSVLATLTFSVAGRLHSGLIEFFVFDSGYDIIVGLPDIIRHFPSFLASQLLHASGRHDTATLVNLSNIVHYDSPSIDVPTVPPWTLPPLPPSPEEAHEPSSHGAYLSVPFETQVSNFFASLDSHMGNAEFASRPLIRRALYEGEFLDVFVPEHWHGIYPSAAPHILPLEVDTLPTLPPFLKPRVPPIPPRMLPLFTLEFARLRSYLYCSHSGPFASPLVAAPKASTSDGKPQIRIAGDYRAINVHICKNHEPLPDALATATKLSNFAYLFDIDARNGFHQIPIGPATQNLLSLQTPTEQIAPLFLPEGVGPASHVFQKVMTFIFRDFIAAGWCFVLIDNVALGANTLDEAEHRLLTFLQRCRDSGVVLKFEKSFYCQQVVTFFGFEITHGSVRMSAARKAALLSLPMPTSLTSMKSFLGCANFFLPFVEHFNILAAPLHDMTKKSFDWSDPEIPSAYLPAFENLKRACYDSVDLFTPDYNNQFMVRCDACTIGVGGLLLMLLPPTHPKYPDLWVPISFFSKKFSDVAIRWATIEQEGYAIYYAVCVAFRQFLYGQEFVLETDHANLLYIEKSTVPKLIRWRLQLQDFVFTIRHIPGRRNTVADCLSRMHLLTWSSLPNPPPSSRVPSCYDRLCSFRSPTNTSSCSPCASLHANTSQPDDDLQQAFNLVHSARSGHHGIERTFQLLLQHFPGLPVPFHLVAEMVRQCPWCQKFRSTTNLRVRPFITHLETTNFPNRGWVGVDVLTLVLSSSGNSKLVVFVVHDTKLVDLFPVKNEEAITIARCAYSFMATYGKFRGFATDPGSCFTSNVISLLNQWMGFGHKLSLVDRHESNGCESTNKSIIRHLKMIVQSERAVKIWDEPEFIMTVKHILNNTSDTEYGLSPHELTFGSVHMLYCGLPQPLATNDDRHEYLQNLNNYLQIARSESEAYHATVVSERARSNQLSKTPSFSPGDLVLAIANPRSRIHKLTPQWLGPHRVISQFNDEVQCRQIAHGTVREFHVSRLIPYLGPDDDTAFELACRDDDQYKLRGILAYRGDPLVGRKYCTFLVEFADQDTCWIQYGPDLCSTEVFEAYCLSKPELKILLMPTLRAVDYLQELRKQPIPRTSTPEICYLDLRTLGFTWYDSLELPDSDIHLYLIAASFSKFTNKKETRAEVYIPILDEYLRNLDKYWFETNAYRLQVPTNATLVDRDFIKRYPRLLDNEILQQDGALPPVTAGTPDNRQGRYAKHSQKQKPTANVSKPRSQPRPPIQEPTTQATPSLAIPTSQTPSQQLRRRSPRLLP